MYKKHIILDFEMNPVPEKDKKIRKYLTQEIIEIGAVMLNEKFEEIDRFSCLVKPEFSADISSYVTKLTGITTKEVYNAVSFNEALEKFSAWIGDEKVRIYSWSDSDLLQIRKECSYKEVHIPDNMKRWLDFQALYPSLMMLGSRRRKLALHDAAEWYGIHVNLSKAHRALYDAEITTELVKPVLNGEYKKQIEVFNNNIVREDKRTGTSLGTMFGDVFRQYLQNSQQEVAWQGR